MLRPSSRLGRHTASARLEEHLNARLALRSNPPSDALPPDLESAVAGADRHRDIVPERFICDGLGNRMLPQTPATYQTVIDCLAKRPAAATQAKDYCRQVHERLASAGGPYRGRPPGTGRYPGVPSFVPSSWPQRGPRSQLYTPFCNEVSRWSSVRQNRRSASPDADLERHTA
jgi:hypothetical protein